MRSETSTKDQSSTRDVADIGDVRNDTNSLNRSRFVSVVVCDRLARQRFTKIAFDAAANAILAFIVDDDAIDSAAFGTRCAGDESPGHCDSAVCNIRSTAAPSGRTPCQKKNASAACSTNMPSPSTARAAPCSRAHVQNGSALTPYTMSYATQPATTAGGTAGRVPMRPADVPLMTRSKGLSNAAGSITLKRGSSSRSIISSARDNVRFATTIRLGPAPSNGPSTP